MSENADFDPGPWRGHDFKSAYNAYDDHVGRSYKDAEVKKTARVDLLESSIETQCTNPLLFFCDVTGSMDEWPKTIFSKLPYLEVEAKNYLGEDLEIAFGAIGDAYTDSYPLQVRPFTSGTDLKKRMLELVIEKKGGGQVQETYELAGLYCLNKVVMPNAIKPILIMIGDEKPYEFISPDMAKDVVGVELEEQVSAKKVFDQLKKKFSVYFIRKPYGKVAGDGNDGMDATNTEIRSLWVSLLGAEHVCDLADPERVVDVTFGILAKETERIEYFKEEIEGRQREDQVKTVYKSLASIPRLTDQGKKATRTGQSILKIEDKSLGKNTKKLL